jgi:hypothetical protein
MVPNAPMLRYPLTQRDDADVKPHIRHRVIVKRRRNIEASSSITSSLQRILNGEVYIDTFKEMLGKVKTKKDIYKSLLRQSQRGDHVGSDHAGQSQKVASSHHLSSTDGDSSKPKTLQRRINLRNN